MAEQHDPEAPRATPSDVTAGDGAKALKRKQKARKHWYNFAGRVVAQVVGAASTTSSKDP